MMGYDGLRDLRESHWYVTPNAAFSKKDFVRHRTARHNSQPAQCEFTTRWPPAAGQ